MLSTALSLMLSTVAHAEETSPVLVLVEAIASGSTTAPGNVPQYGDPPPRGRRLGGGVVVGPVYTHVRTEWFRNTDPSLRPRIVEARLGAVLGEGGQHLGPFVQNQGWMPFVGYRGVRDMESDSFGAPQDVPVRGHGVELGLASSQSFIIGEVGLVGYVAGWPRYDHSRTGMWFRFGGQLGPAMVGMRLDLEPGQGFWIAVDVGAFALIDPLPKNWRW